MVMILRSGAGGLWAGGFIGGGYGRASDFFGQMIQSRQRGVKKLAHTVDTGLLHGCNEQNL
ncbi:hypothetical protein JCM17846_19150 [Iodidimonas nitroreducens]|uniref:Uncharacterized protein n=1 Tax=Iodidimonas nitroreducens TaxID=1236968 RepID=A0A5A7N7C9_9PROT|nr:hypothetical protein JCM17846_19150 [Iodidimonas nitroreducens]